RGEEHDVKVAARLRGHGLAREELMVVPMPLKEEARQERAVMHRSPMKLILAEIRDGERDRNGQKIERAHVAQPKRARAHNPTSDAEREAGVAEPRVTGRDPFTAIALAKGCDVECARHPSGLTAGAAWGKPPGR